MMVEQSEADRLPPTVRRSVASALNVLQRVAVELHRARVLERSVGSVGRYEADVVRNETANIDAAKGRIALFRELAPRNGVDADAAIAALGGLPDVAPSAAARTWLDNDRRVRP